MPQRDWLDTFISTRPAVDDDRNELRWAMDVEVNHGHACAGADTPECIRDTIRAALQFARETLPHSIYPVRVEQAVGRHSRVRCLLHTRNMN